MYPVNPMQLIQAIKNGQNPQQLLLGIIQNQMGNTPIGKNLINLAQQGKTADIEAIVRNLAAQQGMDFDREFSEFKKTLGIK